MKLQLDSMTKMVNTVNLETRNYTFIQGQMVGFCKGVRHAMALQYVSRELRKQLKSKCLMRNL